MANYSDSYTDEAVLDDAIVTSITTMLSDAAVLNDALLSAVATMTTEAAVLNDLAPNIMETTYLEAAVLNDASTGSISPVNMARDSAALNDAMSTHVSTMLSEAAVLNDATSQTLLTPVYTETGVLDDNAEFPFSPSDMASDGGVLNDRSFSYLEDSFTETAVLNDAAANALRVFNLYTEAAVLNDAAPQAAGSWANVSLDSAVLNDNSWSENHAVNVAQEVAYLSDRLFEPLAGNAWSASAALFNMSRYTNFPFNSIAVVDGQLVALAEDGAYVIGAETDNGTKIRASVVGDLTDNIDGEKGVQSVPNVRRPEYLYLSYSSNGTVKFVLYETGDGVERRHEFELPPRAAESMIGGRVKLDRGLASRFFRFGFENVAGSQFTVNEGRVLFNMLQRRA
jgi:hypothetical protein